MHIHSHISLQGAPGLEGPEGIDGTDGCPGRNVSVTLGILNEEANVSLHNTLIMFPVTEYWH